MSRPRQICRSPRHHLGHCPACGFIVRAAEPVEQPIPAPMRPPTLASLYRAAGLKRRTVEERRRRGWPLRFQLAPVPSRLDDLVG